MGFDSPTDNPFVQLAFRGCQRLCQSETTKKEPITSEMMKFTRSTNFSYTFVSFFRIFTHRGITFDKNKTFKNK